MVVLEDEEDLRRLFRPCQLSLRRLACLRPCTDSPDSLSLESVGELSSEESEDWGLEDPESGLEDGLGDRLSFRGQPALLRAALRKLLGAI